MSIIHDEFELVRKFLASGGDLAAIDRDEIVIPCHKRLLNMFSTGLPSPLDLSALVRHVLRRESQNLGGQHQLRVPQQQGWPTIEEWGQHSITALQHQSGELLLEAKPWKPQWLPSADKVCPEADAFAETPRRLLEPCNGDPFLESTGFGYSNYLIIGQRQAVRSVLTAPPGSTLVVNLPTGTGKSLCAQVLSKIPFVDGKGDGVVLAVVPTIALALDQQRAVQHLDFPTAYRGGTDEKTMAQNYEIWRRICDGTQRIVFTSPESLIGGLRNAVYTAAERGHLKSLVIDETHIVDQWGDEFRSSFQEIAGLRRALLRICPVVQFRTLLLSATITGSSLETLKTLFGEPGPFETVSAVQLRSEPAYWFARCECRNEQEIRVLDAIHHLPRPLILYTTRVDDAYDWYSRLKQDGYRRIQVMTGTTPTAEREHIIRDWAAAKTDIIVATSAFGLGVDQRDVRSVVHACVPETLDRFYQEVGRGGRDGNASVSLVIYTKEDLDNARRIGQKKIITVEKGLQRWKHMFTRKRMLSDWRIDVPINVTRKYRQDPSGDYHMAWNIRTLTLMSRASLIRLDDERPLSNDANLPGDAEEAIPTASGVSLVEQQHLRRVVDILDDNHLSKELWERRVEPIRERTARTSSQQFQLLRELLKEKRCVAEIFGKAYSLTREIDGCEVSVAHSCGGCGFCRSAGQTPYSDSVSTYATRIPWSPYTAVGIQLEKYLAGNNLLALFFSTKDSLKEQRRTQCKFLDWLLGQGIRCVICPKVLLIEFSEKVRKIKTLPIMVHQNHDYTFRELPKVPTVLFHPIGEPFKQLDTWLSIMRTQNRKEGPYVLVLPDNSVDPEQPDRLLKKYLPCTCITQEILEEREVL